MWFGRDFPEWVWKITGVGVKKHAGRSQLLSIGQVLITLAKRFLNLKKVQTTLSASFLNESIVALGLILNEKSLRC
jgi:hypothetical protein